MIVLIRVLIRTQNAQNARGFGGGRDGERDAHPRRGVFVAT
jgi:hypothetical protein